MKIYYALGGFSKKQGESEKAFEYVLKYVATTEKGQTAWICTVCGYVYYGEELPENFKCPVCGVDKSLFKKM